MAISSLTIQGFRGFGRPGLLNLAIPTGEPGSGLTVLVGPNSGGKSTIIESFRVIANRNPQSFTEGRRNKFAGDKVSFTVALDAENEYVLRTVDAGGSETQWVDDNQPDLPRIYVLPSRRYFNPYFAKGDQERAAYTDQQVLTATRGEPISNFYTRLFTILKDRAEFDRVLGHVMSPVPEWTIDQAESGQYYLKFMTGDLFHNSDGLGEGLVSLFFIIDALYDSGDGEVIVIDEPELSIHPIYQERVAELLHQYAATRQIIYATHSAHFVSFDFIAAGAKVARIHKEGGTCRISHLTDATANKLRGYLENLYNPHILGLDARKAFFLDEGVVLVEGQEDVLYIRKVLDQLDSQIDGSFYGWGVGGASNMGTIAMMLKDLGFRRVVGILDSNMLELRKQLEADFPKFRFFCIAASDIRSKPARDAQEEIHGLLDGAGMIRPEYSKQTLELVIAVNKYLTQKP